jgi:hypothetical protein
MGVAIWCASRSVSTFGPARRLAHLPSISTRLALQHADAWLHRVRASVDFTSLQVCRRAFAGHLERACEPNRRRFWDVSRPAAGNPMCDVCLQKDGLLIETANVHGTGSQQLRRLNCKAHTQNFIRIPTEPRNLSSARKHNVGRQLHWDRLRHPIAKAWQVDACEQEFTTA